MADAHHADALDRALADVLDTTVHDLPRAVAEARGLMLLDDADHVGPPLESLLGSGSRMQLVITTRESVALPDLSVRTLGPITSEDAVALFDATRARLGLPPELDRATVETLTRQLTRWPIGIVLAALGSRTRTPWELGRTLAELEMTEAERRSVDARHPSLRTVVDAAMRSLAEPEGIAIEQLAELPGSFDLETVAAITSLSIRMARTSIANASRIGLIEADDLEGLPERRFTFSPIVRELLRAPSSPAPRGNLSGPAHLAPSTELLRRWAPHFVARASSAAGAPFGPTDPHASIRLVAGVPILEALLPLVDGAGREAILLALDVAFQRSRDADARRRLLQPWFRSHPHLALAYGRALGSSARREDAREVLEEALSKTAEPSTSAALHLALSGTT